MQYSGKELAEILDVAPATLSQAAKNGHRCKGHPVSQWAVRNENGRLLHYEVPEEAGLSRTEVPAETEEPRPNSPNEGNKGDSASATPTRPESQQLMQVGQMARAINSHNTETTSLLPPGEDYARPVAAGSSAQVLVSALQEGGPAGKAMVLTGSAGALGVLGAEVAPEEKEWIGALAGVVVGLGSSAWGMGLLSGSPDQPQERLPVSEDPRMESGQANEPASLGEAGVQAGRLLGGGAGLLPPSPGETLQV